MSKPISHSSVEPSAGTDASAVQGRRRRRAKAALTNLFTGDALSMPVHWFYNPGDIIRAFPPHGVQRMEAAPELHPSSIMALHSTARGGRGQQDADRQIVGDVILKGRRHLWGRANGHYHHGMKAGDNTLNACCARLLMNTITQSGSYDASHWVQHYIDFMTADPPRHPDTYAESCHRGFFANLEAGSDPMNCGAVTHDTPSMGALVTIAPLALALLATEPLDSVQRKVRNHVWLTHPDEQLMRVIDTYVALLAALLERDDSAPVTRLFVESAAVIPGTRLEKLIGQKRGDAHVVGHVYSLACYISDSWPSVCYLAEKYQNDAEKGLLINTNLGGENAHRGSVLGTLLGLVSGDCNSRLYEQLEHHASIDTEITQWLDRFYPVSAPAAVQQ